VVPYLAVVGALSPDPLGAAELPARAVQLTAAATADMTTAAMLSWSQPKEAAKLASTATERFSQAAKIAAQVRQPSTTQQSLDSAVSRARFHATVQAGWALPELVRAAATTAMLADGRRARTAAGEAAVLLPEPLRKGPAEGLRVPRVLKLVAACRDRFADGTTGHAKGTRRARAAGEPVQVASPGLAAAKVPCYAKNWSSAACRHMSLLDLL